MDGRIGEIDLEKESLGKEAFFFALEWPLNMDLTGKLRKNTDSLQSIVGILLVGPGQCRTLLDPYSFILDLFFPLKEGRKYET